MKNPLKRVPLGTLIVMTVLYFIASGFVSAETHKQPYMELALKHLEKALTLDTVSGKITNLNRAKTNLNLGIWNKEGNRLRALKKVNQANTLIREAIELVKEGIESGTVKK